MEIAMAIMISFFIVLLSTPSFIKVAQIKHLFDDPNEKRKLHTKSIPSMGGIMIFDDIVNTNKNINIQSYTGYESFYAIHKKNLRVVYLKNIVVLKKIK